MEREREKKELIRELLELIRAFNDSAREDIVEMLGVEKENRSQFTDELDEAKKLMEDTHAQRTQEHLSEANVPTPYDLLEMQLDERGDKVRTL